MADDSTDRGPSVSRVADDSTDKAELQVVIVLLSAEDP